MGLSAGKFKKVWKNGAKRSAPATTAETTKGQEEKPEETQSNKKTWGSPDAASDDIQSTDAEITSGLGGASDESKLWRKKQLLGG